MMNHQDKTNSVDGSALDEFDLPTYQMSEKTEQVALRALRDYKKGGTTEFGKIEEIANV